MAAEPLVLVPGLLCDERVWRDAVPAGATPWVADVQRDATLGAMAERLLAAAPAPRFALAGHSMGGRVALEVLRRAPDRVARVALLDTGWEARPVGPASDAERQQRFALVDTARRAGMAALATAWSPGMLHPARHGSALHAEVMAMVARRTPEGFERQVQALLGRPDAADVLAAVRCPALVLCGREDRWSPPERHVAMAARTPGARLVLVDDCGHMAPMEQPAAVRDALAAWLHAPMP